MKRISSNKMLNHVREAVLFTKEYGFTHGFYHVATKVTRKNGL